MKDYGIVTASESGQVLTDSDNVYKDFYVYDLKHDIVGPIEVSNTVLLSGPYQYRITVDKTGYYLFRANVLDEEKDYNPDTGETRELTGYFTLKNKKGEPIETYYFSEFRESIATKGGDSYNEISIGYGPEDVKRPIRYKVVMYLEKGIVYTGQLFLNSSENTDKECKLRLSPNADLYQYDSDNFMIGEQDKNGNKIDSLITKKTEFIIGKGFITKPMNRKEKEEVFTPVAEDGIRCVLMWELDLDKAPPPEVKRTTFTISYRQCLLRLYVDQFLGTWIYITYNQICDNINQMTEEQRNNDNIWKTIQQTILSSIISGTVGAEFAGFPGMLAGAFAGGIVSIGFAIADNAKDTRTVLKKLCDALSKFMENDNKMEKPLLIAVIGEPTLRYGLSIMEYDFPVYAWDGSVYNALGESLCCGNFQYNKYAESELVGMKGIIDKAFEEFIE